jgi:hypothetical protein
MGSRLSHLAMRWSRQSLMTVVAIIPCLLAAHTASGAPFITTADDGVFRTDNQGYRKQPSSTGTAVSVSQNGQQLNAGNAGLYYPHSTIIASDGSITDTQFAALLSTNLTNGGNWTQDSLQIHLAQCFSGGFIDEIDDGNVQNVAIDTASWWSVPSFGSPSVVFQNGGKNYTNGTNTYSNAWYNALVGSAAPNGSVNQYNTVLRAAYTLGDANDPYAQTERPQYFSRSDQLPGLSLNQMDNAVIGLTRANKTPIQNNNEDALVFVGSDQDAPRVQQGIIYNNITGLRHWNDAVNYMAYLLAQGYSAQHIYFYYGNGAKPAPGNALPAGITIDGAGTVANFNSFFNTSVNGSTGQVTVWVADHGGLSNTYVGKVKLKQAGAGKGNVVANLPVGNSLDEYATNPFGNADIQIPSGGITGLASADKMDVLIGDPQGDQVDLGPITSDGNDSDTWTLSIPASDLVTMDQNELAAGDTAGDLQIELADYSVPTDPSVDDSNGLYSGDYSNVNIDSFSVEFGVFQSVPEPGAASLVVLAVLPLLRRRLHIHSGPV